MTLKLRSLAAVLALALALPTAAFAQTPSFTPDQRGEIGTIVREYLMANPEVLKEVIAEMEKREADADAAKHRAAVADNAPMLFSSPRHITLGNPKGDVTVVEFFDYNCAYCKKAMSDMVDMIKNDPKIKFVLKEFPVLGEGSTQAAQVAAAVRMQDKTGGKKYLDFHLKLLGGRSADKARALAVAKEVGMDMRQLEKDMASEEVKSQLAESFKLAEALGLNGTPSYIVGTDVVIGAVGLPALVEKINLARCGKVAC